MAIPAWTGIERRGAPRYLLKVPVALDGGSGTTRDASATGVLFETAHALPAGHSTRLTLCLLHAFAGAVVWLHCEGQVVRSEPPELSDGPARVAARITSHRIAPDTPGS